MPLAPVLWRGASDIFTKGDCLARRPACRTGSGRPILAIESGLSPCCPTPLVVRLPRFSASATRDTIARRILWLGPMPRRKFTWSSLPDEELLRLRFKDLKVTIEGTWLEDCVARLHEELAEQNLRVRPHAWISNEWFSPSDAPGIAVPFYLAHPRLMQLERKMIIDVEGGTWSECMSILRHEAGHVVQHSYQLHRRRRWQQLFGPSSRRYPRYYRPNPASRSFVQHLRLWY